MGEARRTFLGLSAKDLIVLGLYAALLALILPHYQPWEDEGRAWTIVRSFGLFDVLFHVLRYEGHPALWYLLLWPFVQLHMPFVFINCLSAACGLGGIWFLLRFSPFPFFLRAVLPFGFWMAYEYAVVARSYVLFPLLGFIVAHEYRRTPRRPVRMALCLAIFANLSVHAAIVAVAFAASYAWNLLRERRGGTATWKISQSLRAAAIFAASLLFVAVVLWPPHNLQPPVSPRIGIVIRHLAPAAWHPGRIPSAGSRLVRVRAQVSPQPAPAAAAANPRALNLGIGFGSVPFRERLRLVFVYPIAGIAALALVFELLVFALLWRRGEPLLILGQLLLCAFIAEVYLKLWHTGLVWVTLIVLLWAVWQPELSISLRRPALTLQNGVAALFFLAALLQLPWTFAAVRFVRAHTTYPAQAAATYLKSLPHDVRIDGFDHSSTVLPYFDAYPFHLQSDQLSVPALLADRPGAILFRDSTVSASHLALLATAGYTRSHTFCGTPFFPNQPLVPLCLVVLEDPQML
jgi:hypothetical protein